MSKILSWIHVFDRDEFFFCLKRVTKYWVKHSKTSCHFLNAASLGDCCCSFPVVHGETLLCLKQWVIICFYTRSINGFNHCFRKKTCRPTVIWLKPLKELVWTKAIESSQILLRIDSMELFKIFQVNTKSLWKLIVWTFCAGGFFLANIETAAQIDGFNPTPLLWAELFSTALAQLEVRQLPQKRINPLFGNFQKSFVL